MMIGGSALRAAADEVIERGKRFAAHFMEANAADIAFADGEFTIAGTGSVLASMVQSSTMNNPPAEQCIAAAVRLITRV